MTLSSVKFGGTFSFATKLLRPKPKATDHPAEPFVLYSARIEGLMKKSDVVFECHPKEDIAVAGYLASKGVAFHYQPTPKAAEPKQP